MSAVRGRGDEEGAADGDIEARSVRASADNGLGWAAGMGVVCPALAWATLAWSSGARMGVTGWKGGAVGAECDGDGRGRMSVELDAGEARALAGKAGRVRSSGRVAPCADRSDSECW